MFAVLMALACASDVASPRPSPAPPAKSLARVAVMPLQAPETEEIKKHLAQALTDAIAAEVKRVPGAKSRTLDWSLIGGGAGALALGALFAFHPWASGDRTFIDGREVYYHTTSDQAGVANALGVAGKVLAPLGLAALATGVVLR